MKAFAIVCILGLIMSFGCTDKTTKETKTEVKTEVKSDKEAGTQIKITKNGGSVKTKNVEIEIKDEKN